MLIVAENLNTRNALYMDALKKKNKSAISSFAKDLARSGAELINVQCSLDGSGDETFLPYAAEIVQASTDLPLCLDSRNVDALRRTIPLCSRPPLINYLSPDEEDISGALSLVRESRSNLIIRALKGTVPLTFESKLMILEDLIEKANSADIPNERLYADPSIVHIGRGMGQEHLLNTHECILTLNSMVEPPMNTIAWISNVSTGLPKRLQSKINASFLLYLAGAGLDAALVDVLDPEIRRAVYLIKAFRDELVFSPAEMS